FRSRSATDDAICELVSHHESLVVTSKGQMMFGPRILVSHRSRLMSECISLALSTAKHAFECSVIPADISATAFAASGASKPVDLLLIDPSLENDKVAWLINGIREQNAACKVMLLISSSATVQILEFLEYGCDGWIFE